MYVCSRMLYGYYYFAFFLSLPTKYLFRYQFISNQMLFLYEKKQNFSLGSIYRFEGPKIGVT